jgi:capsular polysaccharide biosynthesis protein
MNFTAILRQNRASIIVTTLIAVVASLVFSFLQPQEYRSSFSLLLIDKSSGLDGYAAAKSAERLSTTLGKTMTTAAFADQVNNQVKEWKLAPDPILFPASDEDRREAWKNHIAARVTPEVGLVRVDVFHTNRFFAESTAKATSVVLARSGADFVGGKETSFKIVDFPVTSKNPVRPDIITNVVAAVLLGLAVGLAYALLRGQRVPAAEPMVSSQAAHLGHATPSTESEDIWKLLWTQNRQHAAAVEEHVKTQESQRDGFVRNQRGELTRLPILEDDVQL